VGVMETDDGSSRCASARAIEATARARETGAGRENAA